MDQMEHISHLEQLRDWNSVVEELEKSIAQGGAENEVKADYHLRLGRVLETKFLASVKALRHFQDAYKLNPKLAESLAAARSVYWDLGKIAMVQKLLELELKGVKDNTRVSELFCELGDVLCDLGDYDKATASYSKSLQASGGNLERAKDGLADVQVDSSSYSSYAANLETEAEVAQGAERGHVYMRLARLAKRFAPGDVDAALENAYRADPESRSAAALYEGAAIEGGRAQQLEALQSQLIAAAPDAKSRARLSHVFGVRWASRHQNAEAGSRLLEESVRLDPSDEAAFHYLREAYGKKAGDWDRVLTLAEEAAEAAPDTEGATFLLAQAGNIAWKQMGNLRRAHESFHKLSKLAPEHPQLRAFETQIGESVTVVKENRSILPTRSASRSPSRWPSQPPPGEVVTPDLRQAAMLLDKEITGVERLPAIETNGTSVAPPPSVEAPNLVGSAEPSVAPAATTPSAPPPASVAPLAASIVPAAAEAVPSAAPAAVEPSIAPAAAAAPAPAPQVGDQAKIAELRAAAAKQESQKRYNEYVKTLLQLAAIVDNPDERVDLYLRAADLYTTRFANQAEAIKAYEQILVIEPSHEAATTYLRQMYEKRRDWEKLLGLERREAERLESGPERAAKYLQMAKLATERVKKPDVCIDLWQRVIDSDPTNAEALAALSTLYEKSKEFDKLAHVLEQQAETISEPTARAQVLGRLGAIYGDRLGNDEGAVNAYRALLAIDPNDRKAQEAIKKKYLALGRWDDLGTFYEESGKWDEFIRVLEQQEAKETANDTKIGLLFKIAELWATKKQKADRAAKAYEKVLELDAQNLRAAEALVPIYMAAGNPKGLANVIEVKLVHENDSLARVQLLREVAAIYETRIKDLAKAFDRFLAAFELLPQDDIGIQDVERTARATGSWDRVIESFRNVIKNADGEGDRVLASSVRLHLGDVLVKEVGRVDEALAAYNEVYEQEPDNVAALAALEGLYAQTKQYEALLGIYSKKEELAATDTDRRLARFHTARLYEEHLGDLNRAVELYRDVWNEDPDNKGALDALDRIYRKLERWEDYADVLRRRLGLDATEAELIDLKFRLGQTLEQNLGDVPGAIENYRETLFLDSTHEGARLALEAMLTNSDVSREAAQILEPIYEDRGDHEKLITVLEILARSDEERRVAILTKIARITGDVLGDPARAFSALSRALADAPHDENTRQGLERLAAQAGAYPDLATLYKRIAGLSQDVPLARAYWIRLAHVYQNNLQSVSDAANAYLQVLEADAGDDEALTSLEELYVGASRFEDLIGVYERRVTLAASPRDQERYFVQIAQLYDDQLQRPSEAIRSFRRVLDVDTHSRGALTSLDALFVREKLWNDLAANLEAQLELAGDNERISLMLRLARVRETEMGEVEAAIEGYRTILEIDFDNTEARQALERLGQDPRFELPIADLLEPIYRQSGDTARLIGAHEVQYRRTEDIARRVDLAHQIAQLHEDAAGDPRSAFDVLARALREDPSSEITQTGLERLASLTSRQDEFCQLYETLADRTDDPTLSVHLRMTAARVHEAERNDLESAIVHYRKVLTTDGSHLPAAVALERIFRTAQRYSDLSSILQQKSEITSDVSDKKDALFQAAAIEEDVLEKPEAAIAVYKRLLEIDEDDLRAVDALIRRYAGIGRWEELLGAFNKKIELVADAHEKKQILFQVGALYEQQLKDAEHAVETYARVLELDPDDTTALGRLEVLYEAAENWTELLGILGRERDLAPSPEHSLALQFKTAKIYEIKLDDVTRSIELYREILDGEPSHGATLQALETLKGGTRDPLGAAAVLERVYEAASDFPRLISVYEVQVQHSTDPFQQVELLQRIARIYEDALDNHMAAFETYARAVRADSANGDSQRDLERLANVVSRWADVGTLYDQELAKLRGEPDRYVELGMRTAQIYETQLADAENAITRYRAVLEFEPENFTALGALDRLYVVTDRWQDLTEVLAKEAETAQTPDDILEFRYRLGQVFERRLNDVDRAIAAYRDVLAAAPEHTHAMQALEAMFVAGTRQFEIAETLEPLYRSTGEWEKLARVHEAQLAHTPAERAEGATLGGAEDRLSAYYRLAELYEEKLMDPIRALDSFIRALREYPLDERSAEDAPRLAGMVDQGWDALANAYADIVGLHQDSLVLTTIGKRLARTFEEELHDLEKAEETYKYVLGVDAMDADALANLDRIYEGQQNWESLAQVLEMRVKAQLSDAELVDLYARLGEVYETFLGDIPHAIESYRRIFDGLDRAHEGAIAALARIFNAQGDWKHLDEVYGRELEVASGDVAEAEIRAKIAHLAAEKLGDPKRAIATWKMVLDLRGEDPEALSALSVLHESEGEWKDLTDILDRQFDIAETDEDRVNILTRRARAFSDKLSNDELAAETWSRVLDIDFANLGALRASTSLRRRQGDAQELVGSLHMLVDRASTMLDEDELVEVYRELGRTYGTTLGQAYDAAEAWKKLIEIRPDFEALDALEAIYRGDESWADVINVKMMRAEALSEPAEKIREFKEVAALWTDTVLEADRATLSWQKILEVDSAHDEAFERLEQLHTEGGRWESLIELYLARLDTRTIAQERTDLLRRIARVFEEKLDDKNQAFDALLNALGEDFHDKETARYLERMAQATSRWGELIQTANTWLTAETKTENKIRLCLHLAKWYGDDLGRTEYAQPYYAQIVHLDPNNVGALRQMAQLYRKTANWPQLGNALSKALEKAVADNDRKELMTELGELLDAHMGQTDQAVPYFTRALEVDGHYLPAIEHLERIYGDRNQSRDLVDILARKVQALEDSERIVLTQLRMGGLYETLPDEMQRAASTYREVLERDSANLAGMRGLSRTYEALGDWAALGRTLDAELDVVTTDRERIDVLLKLAWLHEEHFVKSDAAAQKLEQVLEIDPNEEDAFVALERNYRKLRQWSELVNTYERHVGATLDRKVKIDLYAATAQVQADELDDADRAIDAWRNIVDIDDNHVEALEQLSRLYEKQGDAAQSIEFLTRVADLQADGKEKAESYYRIGKALDEKLGDRIAAQDRYEMAIHLDESHLLSLGALRQISLDNSDYEKAARYVDLEQSYTVVPRQRARLLTELGRIREDLLGDHESAVFAWKAAHEADTESEEAAMPLAEEYLKTEQWALAEPLFETLVRKAGKRERSEQHAVNYKLGRVCFMLGKDEKAQKAFTAAAQLDPTDHETTRGLAEVCFRLKDWTGALTNFQKVLTSLGEEDTEIRAEVYFKLGSIKREQGQQKQAISNYEKALGVDPNHRPSLDALVEVYSELKDWPEAAVYKRQILDNVFEGEERFKLLTELGDLWNDNAKKPDKAIEALEEARDLQPDNRMLLHKMLGLYESTGSWGRMIDTIQSLADAETSPLHKSKFVFTIAQIYRDKEGDQDRAVELFNEALDLNPQLLEAFERINKILTVQKDWKNLERAYRKMLRRLSAEGQQNPELEFTLWHQLGIIYRDRLQDAPSAIEAFKMATRYKPDEPMERQILAELYEITEQFESAIGEQSIILQKDPMRIEPYRRLYQLALKQRDYDRAWCMCSALVFLQQAGEDEVRFYEEYKPKGGVQAQAGRLDNEMWVKNLFHKDENIFIGKIFEMVTRAAVSAKLHALATRKELPNLDKKFKQDPANSTVSIAQTFGWAAQVLGVPMPELYVRSDIAGALAAVPASPPASVAGQAVLSGFNRQELAFIVGRHLAMYRGEHYIKNIFPTLGELKVVLFSAIKLIMADFLVPADMAQAVNTTAQQIEKFIQPMERDSLRIVVQRFVEAGAKADLKGWMQATDITAARAGLLLCADMEIAKKVIAAEPQLPGDLPPAEKIKELLVFSVSDQYLTLRKSLGINVG